MSVLQFVVAFVWPVVLLVSGVIYAARAGVHLEKGQLPHACTAAWVSLFMLVLLARA